MNELYLNTLNIIRLQIELEAVEPIAVPAYPGSTLQGLFQSALCDYAEELQWPWDAPAAVKSAMENIKLTRNMPRPYSIYPAEWGSEHTLEPGDIYKIELNMFGKGVEWWRVFCQAVERRGGDSTGRGIFAGNFRLKSVTDGVTGKELDWHDNVKFPFVIDDETVFAKAQKLAKADSWRLNFDAPLTIEPINKAEIPNKERLPKKGPLPADMITGRIFAYALNARMARVLGYQYWRDLPPPDFAKLEQHFDSALFNAFDRFSVSENAGKAEFLGRRGVLGSVLLRNNWKNFLPEMITAEAVGLGLNTSGGKGRFRIVPVRLTEEAVKMEDL